MDKPERVEVERVVAGLTPRPILALKAWRPGEEVRWTSVVAWGTLPTDARAMSARSTLDPLLRRGLAEIAQPSTFDPATGEFTWRLYRLTDFGRAVRQHLLQDQSNVG